MKPQLYVQRFSFGFVVADVNVYGIDQRNYNDRGRHRYGGKQREQAAQSVAVFAHYRAVP